MKVDLAGHTALVTGAAHGFGRAIAETLARSGAYVHAADILEDELAWADDEPHCEGHRLDVTQKADIEALVRAVESAGRSIDILVNCAGGVLNQVGRPIEQIAQAEWQALFDVNCTGAFLTAQAVAPGMKSRRSGRIINISSGAGLGVSKTGIQGYAAAKAAQIGLTRQLAHELGPWGITVNNVAPGFVRSNPATERQWNAMGPDAQRALVDGIALKRLGSAQDIASAVLFFASDAAGWVSGQVLSVNGGS